MCHSDNYLVTGKRIRLGTHLELPDDKSVKKECNLVAEYSPVKEDMRPGSLPHHPHGRDSHCGGPSVSQWLPDGSCRGSSLSIHSWPYGKFPM